MKTSGRRGGKRRQRRRYLAVLAVTVVVLLFGGGYGYWALHRPLPLLQPVAGTLELRATNATNTLLWPSAGQSAIAIIDSPILETHGMQTPVPTASTAKLITALVVLNAKPLALNQPGPILSLTASDVALYDSYVAQDGSVVPVQTGEQISEYQVLQTLLLPSANNMADSLAIWAFGSLDAYKAAATDYLTQHGLTATHIGSDASGFSPGTTSTADDLVKLGTLAMQNPVLAQIVNQSTAIGIPVAGTIKNVNFLLGSDGIIGIKTGNTDQAGGVFVSASRIPVNGKPVTIVTAVVDQPSLLDAMKSSQSLIQSAQTNFKPARVVTAGAAVDSYALPWSNHGNVQAIASQNLTVTTWLGSPTATALAQAKPVPASATAGKTVGTITTEPSPFSSPQQTPLKLQTAIPKPSIWWRFLHPS
jgi:serine-type D-Ala-D-Ala carboxypeptidase (penicillin-binding protein 5/6)